MLVLRFKRLGQSQAFWWICGFYLDPRFGTALGCSRAELSPYPLQSACSATWQGIESSAGPLPHHPPASPLSRCGRPLLPQRLLSRFCKPRPRLAQRWGGSGIIPFFQETDSYCFFQISKPKDSPALVSVGKRWLLNDNSTFGMGTAYGRICGAEFLFEGSYTGFRYHAQLPVSTVMPTASPHSRHAPFVASAQLILIEGWCILGCTVTSDKAGLRHQPFFLARLGHRFTLSYHWPFQVCVTLGQARQAQFRCSAKAGFQAVSFIALHASEGPTLQRKAAPVVSAPPKGMRGTLLVSDGRCQPAEADVPLIQNEVEAPKADIPLQAGEEALCAESSPITASAASLSSPPSQLSPPCAPLRGTIPQTKVEALHVETPLWAYEEAFYAHRSPITASAASVSSPPSQLSPPCAPLRGTIPQTKAEALHVETPLWVYEEAFYAQNSPITASTSSLSSPLLRLSPLCAPLRGTIPQTKVEGPNAETPLWVGEVPLGAQSSPITAHAPSLSSPLLRLSPLCDPLRGTIAQTKAEALHVETPLWVYEEAFYAQNSPITASTSSLSSPLLQLSPPCAPLRGTIPQTKVEAPNAETPLWVYEEAFYAQNSPITASAASLSSPLLQLSPPCAPLRLPISSKLGAVDAAQDQLETQRTCSTAVTDRKGIRRSPSQDTAFPSDRRQARGYFETWEVEAVPNRGLQGTKVSLSTLRPDSSRLASISQAPLNCREAARDFGELPGVAIDRVPKDLSHAPRWWAEVNRDISALQRVPQAYFNDIDWCKKISALETFKFKALKTSSKTELLCRVVIELGKPMVTWRLRDFPAALQTRELCLNAVKRHPAFLSEVPQAFFNDQAWCEKIVTVKGFQLGRVPFKALTDSICFAAVARSRKAYRIVPLKLRKDLRWCARVVALECFNLGDVAHEARTEELFLAAWYRRAAFRPVPSVP